MNQNKRPKVSVIVPVYNTRPFLPDLIRSIKRQTLKDVEYFFVDDGSDDGSGEFLEKTCQNVSEFHYIQQNHKGVSAARNCGLEMARGEYCIFCDSDDILPKRAYEHLYREGKLHDADIVVGKMGEFSLKGGKLYPQTVRQSKKTLIDPFDPDFVFSLTLCNKLIRKTIIDDNQIRFTSHLVGEDAMFMVKCLGASNQIVGCNHLVYDYRKREFFETLSATGKTDIDSIESTYDSLERVREQLLEALERKASEIYGTNEEMADEYYRGKKYLISNTINNRLVGLPMTRYYSYIWNLDAEAIDYLNNKYLHYMSLIEPSDRREQREFLNVIHDEDGSLRSKESFLRSPNISIILSDRSDEKTAELIIKSMYAQSFPGFELIIPKKYKGLLDNTVGDKENVVVINGGDDYLYQAILTSKSSYVNILEDNILHNGDSLTKMWRMASSSFADFVCFNMLCVGSKKNVLQTDVLEVLYQPSYVADPNRDTPLNDFDCSLNNKIFKRQSLLSNKELLKKPSVEISRQAFDCMSYERRIKNPKTKSLWKVDPRLMLCFEAEEFFKKDVGPNVLEQLDKAVKVLEDEKKLLEDNNEVVNKQSLLFRAKRKIAKKRGVLYGKAGPIHNRIVFYTNRNNGSLSTNLQLLYDALDDYDRIVLSEALPHSEAYKKRVEQALLTSKVIITDDYCAYLRDIKLNKAQKVVQLWHACGAFKKFGLDLITADIEQEKRTHKRYDLVSVSSEYVVPIYSGAFGIPVEKVKPLGVPRTDILLDPEKMSELREKMIQQVPLLSGKRVVLYAPTFRQKNGHQVPFDPQIDWWSLSKELSDKTILIVKRHPLENRSLIPSGLTNVLELENIDDLSALAVSDALITDYSSVVFDFALLEKPFVFYVPDIEKQKSGFYLDYPSDFNVNTISKSEDISKILEKAFEMDGLASSDFKEKYMGACDGQSTERIAEYIKDALQS